MQQTRMSWYKVADGKIGRFMDQTLDQQLKPQGPHITIVGLCDCCCKVKLVVVGLSDPLRNTHQPYYTWQAGGMYIYCVISEDGIIQTLGEVQMQIVSSWEVVSPKNLVFQIHVNW